MWSASGEYAVRAAVYLARHEEAWPIPARAIAAGTGVPERYLQKVLGDLVRSGVLLATPGRRGGFRLRHPARRTSVFDVLSPFERFGRTAGDGQPSGRGGEGADPWGGLVASERQLLKDLTVCDLVRRADEGPGPAGAKPERVRGRKKGLTRQNDDINIDE